MGLTVSKLQMVLPVDAEVEAVYEPFRSLLEVSPFSYAELADELDVSRAAVSRWASGDSRPKVDTMAEAVRVIQERIDEIQRHATEALDVAVAAEEAIKAWDRQSEEPGEENREEMFRAVEQLLEVIGEE